MEITEPVILDIQQGRKTVRLEIKTRADARDLIAALERNMERLPDDGVLYPWGMPEDRCDHKAQDGRQCVRVPHRPVGPCLDEQGRVLHYGDPVEPERAEQPAPDPAAIPTADSEDVTCPSCGKIGRHAPSCRRQKKLADLGKQVARLSKSAPLAAVRPLRPDSEVTIIGSVADSSTFNCCRTPLPWPAKGVDVQCPDCRSIWEREPVDIGAGARLKVLVIDGEIIPREHGAAS